MPLAVIGPAAPVPPAAEGAGKQSEGAGSLPNQSEGAGSLPGNQSEGAGSLPNRSEGAGSLPGAGQGADPKFLEQYSATYHFSLGTPQAIRVAQGGRTVVFLRSAARSFVRDLYEMDVATGRERLLASAEKLLGGGEQHLSAEEKARLERARIAARGITVYDLSQDSARVVVPLSGRLFAGERATGAFRQLPSEGGDPLDPRFSPDGARVACVRGGDLYVIDVAAGTQWRLTTGATSTLSHGLAEFVAQEEMERREGYWWSPDSKTIAYEEADTSKVEVFHIADPMHPERQADAWPYPRPGRNNAEVRLGLVAVGGGRSLPAKTVWVDWDRAKYPYLARVTWEKEGPLTLLVQNRRQTEEQLLAVDPATGSTRSLLVESDPAWLNLMPAVPHWLEDGSGFLWISERTGEARLELRGSDGTPRRWLTPSGFGLRSLVGVDHSAGQGPGASNQTAAGQGPGASNQTAAYLVASADPTQAQLWRVPLQGGEPVALTDEPGIHGAVFAHDASASVWSETLLSGGRSWSVRRRDGSAAGTLRSTAEEPPFFPRLELTTAGPLGFRAAIVRPRAFQPGRKYPVLVRVYGGPTAQTVHSSPWEYLLDQWMADHGFVVVTLDGRGTPGRGREWERVIKGNLIDVQLGDQVAGLQALAAKHQELDAARVGMFGWSFGGYFSAMAAMRRPDVYKAAVAGAPVVDWQDYDTHYTERYLGLPADNQDGYRKSSVLTYCGQLAVPLLIVHGTADDNVYILHSLKLADALFRAGKSYEFLVLPGFTHMVPDAQVQTSLQGRIIGFFTARL
ncbi:MAG TPA: DPP IV N-terminal domain-containing protein [Thermoanaerobaculia bacterium]|nr:DPP IV N-terminal domain-containing protein [Thermoanaerobaculia bacterium]